MSTREINDILPTASEEETHALLERCLIEEYLQNKGYTRETLRRLPGDEAQQIMKEASTYASGKLSEIEIRAHFTEDLHDAGHFAES
jgi:hypothetical protein